MLVKTRAVALGLAVMVAAFSNGPAQAQAPQAQAPKSQQEQWCDGLGGVPDDVQISACTVVINTAGQGAARLNTAHFYRGLTYAQTGRCKLAIADFTAAIRYDPKDADAYWSRHTCRKQLGDAAGAAADRKAAQAIDPKIEEQWEQ